MSEEELDTTTDNKERARNRLVLNAREVQQVLGLSRGSVYQGLASGEIPSIKIGRRILIPCALLERYLHGEGNEAAGSQREWSELRRAAFSNPCDGGCLNSPSKPYRVV